MTKANTDKVKGALVETPKPETAIREGMTLKALLSTASVKKRFEEVLGKKAPGFISSILSATATNPALSKCEPMSVIQAAAIAASLDLPINSSLGFAHIVPYGGVAQFQLGWKGFVQLGMRSGQYLTMNATEVYEGELIKTDRFKGSYEFDEGKRTSNKIVGYLFYFKLINGFEKWVYLTREGAEAHGKKFSKSYQKGFGQWVENFDGMALKTVVKKGLSKWGILSIDMQKALEYDQAAVTADDKPAYIDATTDSAPAEAGGETTTTGGGETIPAEAQPS